MATKKTATKKVAAKKTVTKKKVAVKKLTHEIIDEHIKEGMDKLYNTYFAYPHTSAILQANVKVFEELIKELKEDMKSFKKG